MTNSFTHYPQLFTFFLAISAFFFAEKLQAQCPGSAEVFINEFHYDNIGTDVDEFLEVAVLNSAAVTLSDVTVWLYNGGNGKNYGSKLLSALTPATDDGTYSYYVWEVVIQNGDPDGFALSCGGAAFEFISYEGTFEATDGPANGMLSEDIGAAQPSSTPIGSSIQKNGDSWYAVCTQNTKGATNLLPEISIVADNAEQDEGNGGVTPFTFTVNRSGLTTGETTLNYSVAGSGDNPAVGDDFEGGFFPSGSLTFNADETTATITINVAGDLSPEEDEQFTVTLASTFGCYAELAIAEAEVTILNDDDPAGTYLEIVAADAEKPEGNSGTTVFTFTVNRTGDVSGSSSVDYSVAGSGDDPADADDFGGAFPSGTVVFQADETSKVILIEVSGDTDPEADEGFAVTLENPVDATTLAASAEGLILDDDTPPSFSITAANAVKNEGNSGVTPFTFLISRTGDLSGVSSVTYTVSGSGANPADADDFGGVFPSGTVTFLPMGATQVITINVSGDTAPEPDEQFSVALSNPLGAGIDTASADGLILNDDANCPTSAEVFINEFHYDNTGTDEGEFVEVAVLNSSTVAPSDIAVWLYNGSNGQNYGSKLLSNLSPGNDDGTYTYYTWDVVIQNGDPDGFALSCDGAAFEFISYGGTFTAANGAAAGQTSVDIGTKQSNSATPKGSSIQKIGDSWYAVCSQNTKGATNLLPEISIVADNAEQDEGNGGVTPFTFTVNRSGLTTGETTLNYSVAGSGDNPAVGDDFEGGFFPSGSLTFNADETTATITINVAGDLSPEEDEQFTVTLASTFGCYAELAIAEAEVTILNDDDPAGTYLEIVAADAEKPEGNSGTTVFTFTVNRTGDVSGSSSVDYSVAGSGDDPADADDFGGAFPSGTVVFQADETSKVILIEVSGDTDPEADEGFAVTLENPVDATTLAASAEGLILDDDTPPSFSITAANAVKNEGNSGVTPFTFLISRTGDLSGVSSVTYTVSGSGANPADADDFGGVFPSGTVTFLPTGASQVIAINVSGDTDVEPDEQFTVTLSNPLGAAIDVAAAGGTILNDDINCPTAGVVFINEFHYDNEGADIGEFIEVAVLNSFQAELSTISIWLYNGSGGGTYLPTSAALSAMDAGEDDGTYTYYSWNVVGLQNGSPDGFALACDGTAFEFLSYEGVFTATNGPANGQTSVDVGVSQPANTVVGSSLQKIDSTWYATCGQNTNGKTNALPLIALTATDADKAEGDSGPTDFIFTISRSGLTTGATSVLYAVSGSGANPADADDFGGSFPSGTVNFLPEETSKTLAISIAGDTDFEQDEEFTITLTDLANCNTDLAEATAVGVIRNDDIVNPCPPLLSISGDIDSGTYQAAIEIISDGSVPANNIVVFQAGESITLQPEFEVMPNGELDAIIGPCNPLIPPNSATGK